MMTSWACLCSQALKRCLPLRKESLIEGVIICSRNFQANAVEGRLYNATPHDLIQKSWWPVVDPKGRFSHPSPHLLFQKSWMSSGRFSDSDDSSPLKSGGSSEGEGGKPRSREEIEKFGEELSRLKEIENFRGSVEGRGEEPRSKFRGRSEGEGEGEGEELRSKFRGISEGEGEELVTSSGILEVGAEENEGEEEEEVRQERPLSALEKMLQGVPRRRQRFIVQNALKIKLEGESDERASRRGFEMKVIDVNRTVKVTKGGKVQSFAAVVITGNYDGAVGFGKGKSSEIGPAIDKASLRALNNLHYFERFQGHTIFHENAATFEKTKVYLWPARSGTGMRASSTVGGILRLAGYRNVKSKVIGSRHPFNTVKAVFKTLSEIESPDEVAERRGRVVVESHLIDTA